jgi:dolichol-phosphate mannosyltransferase
VLLVRLGLAGLALGRIVRAASRRPPVRPTVTPSTSISVVIPARDEAARIGPLLEAVVGAPGVTEVLVVDDRSTDATATVAATAGARVLTGAERPEGWAGKAWALQQGIEAARGEWVVTLDADTRPDPSLPAALVARAVAERADLVTVAGSFECPTPGIRWLHPAMLTTLVYRFGPPGSVATPPPDRTMANGQCTVVPRRTFLDRGGMTPVAGHPVEDVALARHLAAAGARVLFLDAADSLTVRMYDDLGEAWTGWGRSLALPGVEPRGRQLLDLAVVSVAQALPVPRLLVRRGDLLDVVLLAVRLGTLAGTAPAYRRRGAAYWASITADVPATVALALGVARRRQTWRGRDYDVSTLRLPGR